ncbi:DNA repair protein RecN, partial [Glutamicibacter creatinolyticus]
GILASELSSDISAYLADLDEEGPERLAQVEARRAELGKLLRKYAPSIDEVLQWADASRTRLEELGGDDTRITELQERSTKLGNEVSSLAAELTRARTKAAKLLSKRVSQELTALAMPDAKLVVQLEALEEPGAYGQDSIAMLLAPHAGA